MSGKTNSQRKSVENTSGKSHLLLWCDLTQLNWKIINAMSQLLSNVLNMWAYSSLVAVCQMLLVI